MLSPLRDQPEVPVAAAAMEKEAEKVTKAGWERKRKKTMGRQKIEIKPIKSMDARNVCFSKRRNGLFKKATQLCALTDAHLAIIVFSPAGKPFPFGQPTMNALIDGYLDPGSYVAVTSEVEAAAQAAALREHHVEEEHLEIAIKEETQRRSALDAAARAAGAWTSDDDVRGKGMAELVDMLAKLERVQAEAAAVKRAYEIFAAEEAAFMMQQCAAATGASGDAFHQFQYSGGGGAFTADGGGAGSSHQEDMDLQMMLMMGGNVSHGLPFAPMLLPPDLPAQPPYNYNYGSDHNHIAGYGYGYDLEDGDAMGGYYGTTTTTTTTTTCNFFW